MKIVILFLAIISCAFVAVNAEGMCRHLEVKVYSSIQGASQTFTLDVKKLKGIKIDLNADQFKVNNLVPLEQVGFVLEKTTSSKVLDATHHKYLRNEPESVWFPYSYTGDWTRNGYIITNQMTRTPANKKEMPLVSFEFINDQDLESISKDDMNKILSYLQNNSNKRKDVKTYLKKMINKQQNTYLDNHNSAQKMKQNNQDAKTQISELTIKIQKITTEINILIAKEKKSQEEAAVKSANLKATNDKIDDINLKLKTLVEQLKREESELNLIKPEDTSHLEIQMKTMITTAELPQNAPERFLEEFQLAKSNYYSLVKEAYANCNKKLDNFLKCFNVIINNNFSFNKKKLRKSFF